MVYKQITESDHIALSNNSRKGNEVNRGGFISNRGSFSAKFEIVSK